MKQYSFNQIQFRILSALFIFFTLTIICYRVFIERPQIEQGLTKLSQRELSTLIFSANNLSESFSLKARDYAVWSATYRFMKQRNTDFIQENLNADTFKTLQIDGMFFINENMETVAGRSFSHKEGHDIDLGFNDFKQFPDNIKVFPKPTTRIGAPKKSGIIMTTEGVALFSSVQIRKSDQLGEHRGFVVFLRLIDQALFSDLSRHTMSNITYEVISDGKVPEGAMLLSEIAEISEIRKVTHLYEVDINQKPLLLLSLEHSNGKMPPVLELQSIVFILMLMVLIVLIYQVISSLVIQPVAELADDIKDIGDSGEASYLKKQYPISELTNISTNFNGLVDIVSQQTRMLAEQAYLDQLTQLSNRRGFEEHFQTHLQLCIRQKISFVVIMADVDHFKSFNDLLGHVEGDHALVQVAQTLQSHFQRANDLCARYGGEEFIMLYNDMSKAVLAEKLEAIIGSFARLNLEHPASTTAKYVTVSLGACIISPEDINNHRLQFKSVVRRADLALYQAKNSGRNRWVINQYSDSMSHSTPIEPTES